MENVPLISEALAAGGVVTITSMIRSKWIFRAHLTFPGDAQHINGAISTSVPGALDKLEEAIARSDGKPPQL